MVFVAKSCISSFAFLISLAERPNAWRFPSKVFQAFCELLSSDIISRMPLFKVPIPEKRAELITLAPKIDLKTEPARSPLSANPPIMLFKRSTPDCALLPSMSTWMTTFPSAIVYLLSIRNNHIRRLPVRLLRRLVDGILFVISAYSRCIPDCRLFVARKSESSRPLQIWFLQANRQVMR